MFRRLVLAVVLVVVVAGVGVAVQPAVATPQEAENGTAFEASTADTEVAGEATRLNVTGLDAGTPVEITVQRLASAELAGMIDGEQTAAGVRTAVPANGSIPVAAPPACTAGRFTLRVQRLDTGERTTAAYEVTREQVADAAFDRRTYSGWPGTVVPVTVETECHGVTLRIADPDSPYEASVTATDDGDRNHTVWIDTSEPMNASALFTTEADALTTDRRRYGVHTDLNGTYRLLAEYSNDTLATANLTVSPDGTPRPTAEAGTLSAEVYSDGFSVNDADEDRWFLFGLTGVDPSVPVTAHLRNASADIPSATVAAMVSNGSVTDDPRMRRFENGTVPVSVPPGMRCRTGELTFVFQRRDTGATVTAEATATHYSSLGTFFERENYSVESGAALPVTLVRACHELRLELTRTDSNASAAITLGAHDPIDRRETVWLNTASAGDPSALFRTAVGTSTRNATTNLSDGALAPGTYRLETVFSDQELSTATLTVTNRSTEPSPSDSMSSPPETSPPTPDAAPPTALPSTDTPTTEPSTTDATPSNRTVEGNAMRPAGTDPFGTTATTTDGTGPGFGPILAAFALAVLAVRAARRNDH